MTLDYGNYGIFLIVGTAGFISSTVLVLLCILTTKTSPQVGSPLCDFGVELAALVRDCDPRLELMGARVGFFIKVKVPM